MTDLVFQPVTGNIVALRLIAICIRDDYILNIVFIFVEFGNDFLSADFKSSLVRYYGDFVNVFVFRQLSNFLQGVIGVAEILYRYMMNLSALTIYLAV